jgi:putative colanic acid biosynthesis glycosyltransferase
MTQFSIVTINWNNLAGLKATYQSVRRQTYRNFRWIVIDGASDDGAAEWLAKLNDPQAEITCEPDRGLYDAMEKGRQKAVTTPGYTLFLNSGDSFSDARVLERVAAAIESAATAPGYVYGNYLLQSASGRLTQAYAKPIERLAVGMLSSHQAMYFENEHLKAVHFRDDYKLSADYCMIIEFTNRLDHAREVLRLDETLCIFDLTGVSEKRRFAAIREDVHIRDRYMGLPAYKNYVLYGLHYLHAYIKLLKAALDRRFNRDSSTNKLRTV